MSDGDAVRAAAQVAGLWRWVRWGAATFCLFQFAFYVPGPGVRVPWPLPILGVALAVLTGLVNIAATSLERRRPRRAAPSPAPRDLLLLAADTAIVVAVVQLFAFAPATAAWALLVVPVLEAGLVGRLRWALRLWAVAVAAVLIREVLAVQLHHLPAQSPRALMSLLGFRIGLLLLVAVVVGVQASVAHEHLRQLDAARLRLAHEADHDHLTGLAARRLFLESAQRALRHKRHGGGTVGVLFLDCNSFKPVNDHYGHAAGDEVLQQVATRLRAIVGPDDTVARLGGDEFAVLVHRPDPGHDLAPFAADVRALLAQPYTVSGRSVSGRSTAVAMSCSVGGAVHRDDEPLTDLLRRADEAMYADKLEVARLRAAGRPAPTRARTLPG